MDLDESNTPPAPPSNYDTLVVSGASVKGIVALGALQYAMDNHRLRNVTTYIGTSSGAMICYLLAIGYTPAEILAYICSKQIMEKMQHFNIVAMMQGLGATSFHPVQEQLEKMTMSKVADFLTLGDLRDRFGKTLICVTYNVSEGKVEYLSPESHPRLPCITALRMSANLPLIFEHYRYRSSLYVDGGISNNFPINLGDEIGAKVLGISVDPTSETTKSPDPDTDILEYIYRLIFVPVAEATRHKIAQASDKCKVVSVAYEKTSLFSFKVPPPQKLAMFDAGYSQMRKAFES
jgi:predicted acylesterase/phospholipase RssA